MIQKSIVESKAKETIKYGEMSDGSVPSTSSMPSSDIAFDDEAFDRAAATSSGPATTSSARDNLWDMVDDAADGEADDEADDEADED